MEDKSRSITKSDPENELREAELLYEICLASPTRQVLKSVENETLAAYGESPAAQKAQSSPVKAEESSEIVQSKGLLAQAENFFD